MPKKYTKVKGYTTYGLRRQSQSQKDDDRYGILPRMKGKAFKIEPQSKRTGKYKTHSWLDF